jgi:acetyl-CoA C-acetyltransferase
VAVVGFQKMSEISSAETQERMGRGADIQWESPFGTMMPAYYAMYARAHMDKPTAPRPRTWLPFA